MNQKPVQAVLQLFNHRWTLEILAALTSGPQRFNSLQRVTGNINAKTHRDALQRLVKGQLVRPPSDGDGVHYALTTLGERALPALRAFAAGLSHAKPSRPRQRV
ncbi:winged helix-turn-helix transcriptional regulator [Micromonospora craniellae]|uniref:Transcriptional regulator n=1 Tax=Micromonospora craniellae TaxID=2294034 RepID=A0A372FQD8_9ACTN|nr:helix-turn-helix transcriptional regulator [Micromonospora craniellae]RFS39316.1 transcriptional regulator [Micromonospora craniellae]